MTYRELIAKLMKQENSDYLDCDIVIVVDDLKYDAEFELLPAEDKTWKKFVPVLKHWEVPVFEHWRRSGK